MAAKFLPLLVTTAGCSDSARLAATDGGIDGSGGASPDVTYDAPEPDVGDLSADAGRDSQPGDATADNPGGPKLLERVTAVVAPNCAVSGCHDAITKEHGMDLSTAESIYTGWVNQKGLDHCKSMALTRVVPGNPNGSYVMTKITATTKACDLWDPMPPPPKQPLTMEQIDTIRSWIAAGARRDDP